MRVSLALIQSSFLYRRYCVNIPELAPASCWQPLSCSSPKVTTSSATRSPMTSIHRIRSLREYQTCSGSMAITGTKIF
jgi:hypothetical protein